MFIQHLKEWSTHCEQPSVQASSSGDAITNCDAYRELVNMGEEIFPLIYYSYLVHDTRFGGDKTQGASTLILHGFPKLVHSIAGDKFKIPGSIRGHMSEIATYTYNWLYDHLTNKK